ncbi:uncharacterized protein LY79DRAFT_223016 [Colletotrichum navitas]|uniref:Uncharacterized protein n=1 Tax=Colletotrichum navitas TaxID=681940 RepID=A0AAD8PYT9_9PEZI|nr:uncharacterized protein LY79DRAFT_223016 [Colletotrichum navitas]KAK1590140.1 hypothetical protein LY79DRAFT_223016 [Colletotrichum navitas]
MCDNGALRPSPSRKRFSCRAHPRNEARASKLRIRLMGIAELTGPCRLTRVPGRQRTHLLSFNRNHPDTPPPPQVPTFLTRSLPSCIVGLVTRSNARWSGPRLSPIVSPDSGWPSSCDTSISTSQPSSSRTSTAPPEICSRDGGPNSTQPLPYH